MTQQKQAIHRRSFWLLSLMMALSVAVVFTSCQKSLLEVDKDGTLQLSTTALFFPVYGGTETLTVNSSTGEYKISDLSSAPWVIVEQKDKEIMLNVSNNEEKTERSVTIRITDSYTNDTKSLLVRQSGKTSTLQLKTNTLEFSKDGGSQTLALTLDGKGKEWSAKLLYGADWCTITPDKEKNELLVSCPLIDKKDPVALSFRSQKIVLSYGANHEIVDVVQKGWDLFPEVFMNIGATRTDVEKWNEENKIPKDEEWNKTVNLGTETYRDAIAKNYVYKNENAILGTRTIYHYDDKGERLENIYMKADEGQAFPEDILENYILKNKYVKGGYYLGSKNGDKPIYSYYKDDGEVTTTIEVDNYPTTRAFGLDKKGAYVSIRKENNQVQLSSDKKTWLNFPTRNLSRLNDPNYKLAEVIEYEKRHGMIPAFNHPQTQKNEIKEWAEQVPYQLLIFVPEVDIPEDKFTDPSNFGKRIMTSYQFSIPGRLSEDGRPLEFNSDDPALAGSVSERRDIYLGNYFSPIGTGYKLNAFVENVAKNRGFKVTDRKMDVGWYYFIRGDKDEIAYILPLKDGCLLSCGKDEKLHKHLSRTKANNE